MRCYFSFRLCISSVWLHSPYGCF